MERAAVASLAVSFFEYGLANETNAVSAFSQTISPAVNLYGYSFALNSNNVVQSLTLPNNANVEVLAIITAQIVNNTLTLSWPADHTGRTLQTQTNNLGTKWVDVAGSTMTNQATVSINPSNGCGFFRLIYP
jgi:hypothetical protein